MSGRLSHILKASTTEPVAKIEALGNHRGAGWESPSPLVSSSFQSFSNTDLFEYGDTTASIRVKQDGIYQVTGSVAFSNLPGQPVKYILLVRSPANALRPFSFYLTRGFVELPSDDWWGTSGVNMVSLLANEVLEYRVYVANNAGSSLGVLLNYVQVDLNVIKL